MRVRRRSALLEGSVRVVVLAALLAGGLAAVAQEPGAEDANPPLIQQRLLIAGQFRPEGGVLVHAIDPSSPTTRMVAAADSQIVSSLAVGDLITHVNGEPVDSPVALVNALNRFAGAARLTVISGGTGLAADWISATEAVPVAPAPLLAPATDRRTAWVVLAGLTDDEQIGRDVETSLLHLERLLQSQVAPDRLRIQALKGPACNAGQILETIRLLPVGGDDTLLVYYLGHGAFDVNAPDDHPTRGQFFTIPSGDLLRTDLQREMEARPARLRILLSDTCNMPGKIDRAIPAFDDSMPSPNRITGLTATEKLLFNFRGSLDVGAASPGDYSWYTALYGGWFTWTALHVLPRQGDWNGFLSALPAEADSFFQKQRTTILSNPGNTDGPTLDALQGQTSVTPKVFQASIETDVAEADSQDVSKRLVVDPKDAIGPD
jgi:hypothetical protein